MTNTATLPLTPTHNAAASDAHADIASAMNIIGSLVLSDKLHKDDADSVRFFLREAQREMKKLMAVPGK